MPLIIKSRGLVEWKIQFYFIKKLNYIYILLMVFLSGQLDQKWFD